MTQQGDGDPTQTGDAAASADDGTAEQICGTCSGSGKADDADCPECGGSGKVIEAIGGA